MMIIGELFDRGQAQTIERELRDRGVDVRIHEITQLSPGQQGGHQINEKENQARQEVLYQLVVANKEQALEAHEYFRVKMGMPGAPPAPDPDWQKIKSFQMGPVTKGLLAISLMVFALSYLQPSLFEKIAQLFFFNDLNAGVLESIATGEVWRLITPIFLHFGFLHILFNGMWIKDLGAVYESEKGSAKFLIFIVVVSALSNFLQYLAMGPRFGGLSGLVYGLFGYLWVYGATHESAQIRLPKRDVFFIVGWYFLCLLGVIGPIANVAHGVGLGVGMLWGIFPLRDATSDQSVLLLRFKYIAMALFFTLGTYLIELFRSNL